MDDEKRLCSECGGPVAYGSRHHHCGTVAMKYQAEIERLRDVALLVMRETGEDADGNMPHEPREALLLLRNAAKSALTPNDQVVRPAACGRSEPTPG